ncbi:MAG: hypothetical protein HYX92_02095 [Chloroflexi bacterium]|nr:hypothetical protein [Chloroflexota bacterium]
MKSKLTSEQIPVDDYTEAVELFHSKGWTDGLPIIPPTEERVSEFLQYVGLEPDEVVGEIRERAAVKD